MMNINKIFNTVFEKGRSFMRVFFSVSLYRGVLTISVFIISLLFGGDIWFDHFCIEIILEGEGFGE